MWFLSTGRLRILEEESDCQTSLKIDVIAKKKEEINLKYKLQGLHIKQRIVNTRDSFAAKGSVSSILLYDLGMAGQKCLPNFKDHDFASD